MKSFFITIPHAGETVPEECAWLGGLPEPMLMRDVDRYVDKLYLPIINKLNIHSIVTKWHRYVVNLNRTPDDIDKGSVVGADNPKGLHPKGLHWSLTTDGEVLIKKPISMKLHNDLLNLYYFPFHQSIKDAF